MYGICTGCKDIIKPGPYYVKRSLKHLRLLSHNHDAIENFNRIKLPTLYKIYLYTKLMVSK